MAKLYAVGDVHGTIAHLTRLVKIVPFEPEDQIVFIGDYIDRGPDSRGTVEFLLAFREQFPKCVFLRGNHEELLENFLNGTDECMRDAYLINGGGETLTSYALNPLGKVETRDFPKNHLDFLFTTMLTHGVGGFLFVHAGIRPGVALEAQSRQDLLWIREEFFTREHALGLTVVFGHTPLRDVFYNPPYAIGIDTGAVFGGKLTCVELGDGKVLNTYQA